MLTQLLQGSKFSKFLDIDPHGTQLPLFIATASGIKPAMDIWVHPEVWSTFTDLVESLGMYYYLDTCFDLRVDTQLSVIPQSRFTTTRAALARRFERGTEAHVFLSRTHVQLEAAIQSGWYPLVVGGYLVDKHPADHNRFGLALGYPPCCRTFFLRRNNWYNDNTYYAAYSNTPYNYKALSNGLLRHTAYSFQAHMPCSFACNTTIEYSHRLRAAIEEESAMYAHEIFRRLTTPILCLSELKIYRFEGYVAANAQIYYTSVENVPPTKPTDQLYPFLVQGDLCVLESAIIRIYKKGKLIHAYMARADHHGPEVPFIVQCS